ncbi:GA module-containing protein, partial [Staphylococcus epidermidis]|uniref:GA module-containing protein n=1 Tax=Staphylococcus epidermidis TaxID=1282 RepID=UPI0016426FC9
HQQPKHNYHNSLQPRQTIIHKLQHPIINKNQIHHPINQINTTQTPLTPQNKLHTHQQTTNTQIQPLSTLNTPQINPQKHLLNQPKTRTHLAQNLAPAKQINSPITNLTHPIQNKQHIKRTTAYINADP